MDGGRASESGPRSPAGLVERLSEEPFGRGTRLFLATMAAVGLAIVVLSPLGPGVELERPLVLVTAVLVGSAAGAVLILRELPPVQRTALHLVIVAAIAAEVWATGGIGSPLRHLFVLVLLGSAVILPLRHVIATAATVVLASYLPVLYGSPTAQQLTGLTASLIVWLLGAAALHVLVVAQRRYQGELLAEQQRFELLAENSADGIFLLDLHPEPHYVYVNPAHERITGISAEQHLRDPDVGRQYVHPDDRSLLDAEWNQPLPVPITYRIRRPQEEEWRWVSLRRVAIRDEQDRVVAVQGVLQDVDAEVRASEARERALQREHEAVVRLRQLDELKSTFLMAVSHELRTPLTSVAGFAEVLANRGEAMDEVSRARLLDRLQRNAGRLSRLLDDLLDLERLGRGSVSLRPVPTRLDRLVEDVVDTMDVETHPIEVATTPVTVPVDDAVFRRVIENLVRNACRHTPPGTHVWVDVGARDGGATIEVADAGRGIPPGLRSAILEPFVQGEAAASAPSPGTGIGLSLVARFVALHGGQVEVAEREGGGARIVVTLPGHPEELTSSGGAADPR